tara:strand:- start:187 stop:1230 length:1044 start_codon:yes stop_codon:yes gene_type:complete
MLNTCSCDILMATVKQKRLFMQRMRRILILITILTFNTSCIFSQNVNYSFTGKLLYVEGSELTSGTFGNIVMIDSEKKEKRMITADFHFDESPFLTSDQKRVIFLSKRRKGDRAHGLSKWSDVYSYELETGEIKEYGGAKTKGIMTLFGLDSLDNPIIEDVNKELNREITITSSDQSFYPEPIGNSAIRRLFLARDSTLIVGNYLNKGVVYNLNVFTYDYERKIFRSLLKDKIEEETNTKFTEKFSCRAGGFMSENKVLILCELYSSKISKLYRFDLKNGELSMIRDIGNLSIFDSPVTNDGGKHIFFIAAPFDNERDEEIWMYEEATDELVKITDNRYRKTGLMVY